jgi:hypothetical protein
MGSLAIFRALLYHIQSERSPVFRAEMRAVQTRGGAALFTLLVNLSIFGLLIGGVLVSALDAVLGYDLRDNLFSAGLIIIGFGISMVWVLPQTLLAGGRVTRVTEAYDVLRVTPLSAGEIALARAAAGVRRAWVFVVGAAVFGLVLILLLGGVALSLRAGALMPLLLLLCVGLTAFERVQEISLATLVGLAVPMVSPSLTFLLGTAGGVLLRVVPLVVMYVVLPSAAYADPILAELPEAALVGFWFALASVGGPAVLLALVPGLPALAIIIVLIGVRELLTRALYAWIVRRHLT